MGKKKSGTQYTSKGIVGTTRSRKRHWEEGYQSDRIMNQLKAHLAGKRVMLTIANPNNNETNKPFIKVPASTIWRGGKR
tara:strand:- start:320 stop:556 length:237 start_codon:yes stop_codon:yes gene_type:complete